MKIFKGVAKEAIERFDTSAGIKMVEVCKQEKKGREIIKMYDAAYLVNRMVDALEQKRLVRTEIYDILEKVKEFVKDNTNIWQKDERGCRRYSKKLKYDRKALSIIKETKGELEKFKKVWEWEQAEHVKNSEYINEIALIENYFEEFLKGESDEEREEKASLFKDGWVSLIDGVQEIGCWWTEYLEGEGETFYVIGEADIESRDTLYYVTTEPYSEVWVTLYLNIINIVYQKPLLAVLRLTSKGVICEENIYKFNFEEEKTLIDLCTKCVECPLDEREVRDSFSDWEETIKEERVIGIDRTQSTFVEEYINSVIEGVEDIFDEDTVPFIKKLLFKKSSEDEIYECYISKISFVSLILDVIDCLCEIQGIIGAQTWRIIVNHVVNNQNFLPVFSSIRCVEDEEILFKSEIFMRLVRVLCSISSAYSMRGYSPYILAQADYRRVNLELILNREQREMLDKFLTNKSFYPNNRGIFKKEFALKQCVLKKEVSSEYFCENDVTLLRMPFKFITKLDTVNEMSQNGSDVQAINKKDLIIEDVMPSYYLDHMGELQAQIVVECRVGQSLYQKTAKVVFTFTDEMPHKVLDAFFKSFWIESCTYDFDSWIGLCGCVKIIEEGEGFPAIINRKKAKIEFLLTEERRAELKPVLSF